MTLDVPPGCDAHLFGEHPSVADGRCRCMTCGRCGHHSASTHQGHYGGWCRAERAMRESHFCCKDPAFGCELDSLPAWPRDITYVHVTPEHVTAGKPASLTECAAALAIAEAIGPDTAVISVDVDLITAHEKHAPFRWWHAETPPEAGDWLTAISGYGFAGEFTAAAELGLLDFELSWTEGAATAAGGATE
jgi:hypothetical protein